MPSIHDYMPVPSWRSRREDPIDFLAGSADLLAGLTEAIDARLDRGDRHTHPAKGGCRTCAEAAADTAVRYLEANARLISTDVLADGERDRARSAMRAMPYLGSGFQLLLANEMAADPDFPTIDHLLNDLETIRDALLAVRENDRARDSELRRFRSWAATIREVAAGAADQIEQLDSASLDEIERASL